MKTVVNDIAIIVFLFFVLSCVSIFLIVNLVWSYRLKLLKCLFFFGTIKNKEICVKIAVGKESMKDEDLVENIEAAISEIEKKLPRKNDNVKDVLIKFTMTKPVVIRERR